MTGNGNKIIGMGGNGMPKVIPAHLSTADTCRCILHDTETKFKMFNFFLHVGLESDRFLYRN